MKKTNQTILAFLGGIALTGLVAFKSISYETKKNTAEVEQYEGIYIFTDSKPVSEYEYLGTTSKSLSLFGSGQYQDIRDKLIKKAKKEYPSANAIILNLKDGGTDKADIVRIK